MNLTEYNAMPEGDLKLAVRLAITMGWNVSTDYMSGDLFVWDGNWDEFSPYAVFYDWNPFTDASIPYGLIGRGVAAVVESSFGDFYAWCDQPKLNVKYDKSKTHAILNAFCAADPSGHLDKFLKGE